MLEARVIEVSTDDAKKLGVDWSLLNRQGFVIVEGNPGPTAPGGLPEELPFVDQEPGSKDLVQFKNFTRQAKAFQVAIDLLIREGNARVLASPKIATLNGKQASMLIGSRIPFIVSGTVFAGGAAAPTQRIEREEVGIKPTATSRPRSTRRSARSPASAARTPTCRWWPRARPAPRCGSRTATR
jgi:type IV pilus assembly protein PilQ